MWVRQLRVARGRLPRIDVLLISAGSNSLDGPNSFGSGFGDLISYCLNPVHDCDDNTKPKLSTDLDNSFKNLPSEYQNLAKEINCINPADGTLEPSCKDDPQKKIPKLVLITEYMDPTHKANGDYPKIGECPGYFNLVDQPEWQFFHDRVVVPLNNAVDNFPTYAAQAGLTVPTYAVTGIADDFHNHGICSGSQRWVNDIKDSENLLGPAEPPGPNQDDLSKLEPPNGTWINGTGHPISARYAPNLGLASPCCRQEVYRDRIYAAVIEHSLPVTTARATVGEVAYTFGTWANQDVVVTLSVTSPLGLKQTVYGVDNPMCVPVTWPDCSTYSGPFTLSTSGKHTVTFSSLNVSGLLAPFQNDQGVGGQRPTGYHRFGQDAAPPQREGEDHRIVRLAISGDIMDQLSGVDASRAAYMVKDDDGVLQTSGALTLATDGTYSTVVSFKRTRHREDAHEDEHERDRNEYKIIVSAKDNAGNQGSVSAFAARESHRGHEENDRK